MTRTLPETDAWLSDDPISPENPALDLLDRQGFADASVSMLDRLREQSESSVVALIGPWGAGKSSVLNMIRNRLPTANGDVTWRTVDFNPWNYQDLASLQAGFFTELQSELPPGTAWSRARDALSKIGRRVAPLGSLGSIVGVDAAPVVEAIADLVGGDQSLAAARHEAEAALRETGQPVLVIVDDLDRLAPEELLLVFKLIRLTGRLPHLYYLVSYDEDTLLDALSRTGLVGKEDPRRAVDYLEKIVQIRLDLPPLREHQVSTWVDNALNRFANRFSISLGPEDSSRFSRAYHAHIRARLNTPRSIKRYFSQVEAFFQPVRTEVDVVDFLLVTWLRTAEPLVYELLVTRRAELLGTNSAWSVQSILGKEDPKEKKKVWHDRLEEARVTEANLSGVADVLSQLFPRFEDAWKEVESRSRSHSPSPGRISHPDYFDRYFAFGVPPEDIADTVVELAFHQIISRQDGSERSRVETEFPTKTSMIVDKLENLSNSRAEDLLPLLEWFLPRYHELEDELAFVTPRHHVRWTTQRLFIQLDSSSAVKAIDAAGHVEEGLSLAAHWIDAAARNVTASQPQADSFASARKRFIQLIAETLDGYRQTNPLEVPDYIWALIWEWRRLEPSGVGGWMAELVRDNSWPVLDIIARLVGAQAPLGTPEPTWTLDALDLEAVEDLVGLDFAISSLSEELDEFQGTLPMSRTVRATPDSRRAFALASLKLERSRRAPSDPAEPTGTR
ncbi:P-loop NTPase fold protein [Pseudarthrobacter sp. NPDC058119]|uniref:KAP family P-loop NTPase fold protein n=1 Tax=Pseudarthrobacter sp. NPDC058119 TaxID=3346348 RepID=UPI0036DE25C7